MAIAARRVALGFAAGALAHPVFQGALGELLFAADLVAAPTLSLAPVPPLGVPTTVNNMFWDGLWGMLYALAEPRLTPRVGPTAGGLLLGLASLLVFWLVVLPLKGAAVFDLDAAEIAIDLAFDAAFGLGTAMLFAAGLTLTHRRSAA